MRLHNVAAVSLIALLFQTATVAADPAVSSINGQLELLYWKYEYDDIDSDGTAHNLTAQGVVPLGQHFGLSLVVQPGGGEVNGLSYDYDYDYLRYTVTPFWRDPKIGLVGFSYGRLKFEFGEPVDWKGTRTDKALHASAYLGPVTLSLWRERHEAVDSSPEGKYSPEGNYLWTNAVWYVVPDFLVELEVGAQDAKKTYSLAVEHQVAPASGFSWGLIYGLDRTELESSAWYLTLAYRFAGPKSLMQRYREDLFSAR